MAARDERRTIDELKEAFFIEDSRGRDIVRRLSAEYELSADGSISRDEFIRVYLDNFVAGYQERAALALGDIGTPEAIAVLQDNAVQGLLRGEASEAALQAIEANSGASPSVIRPMVEYAAVRPPLTVVDPIPEVQVVSAGGDPLAGVLVSFQPADGTVARDTQSTSSSGLASPGGWTLGQAAGVQVLTASIPGAPVTPVDFSVTVPGPPATLDIFDGDGQTAPAGSVVGTPPKVIVESTSGPVPGVEVVFTATSDGSVTRSRSVTNEMGIADAGLWRLRSSPGPDTLEALTSGLSVSFTAASLSVGPHILDAEQRIDRIGYVGRAIPDSPVAVLFHPAGSAAGYAVQFTPLQGGGRVVRGIGVTDNDGRVAPNRWILGPTPGLNVLRAASPGIADTALFVATAVPLHRIAMAIRSSGRFRIVTADESLDNQQVLPTGAGNSITPAWSPDGSQIAFASDRNGNFDIYVIPADGSGMAVRLTDSPGDEFAPTWAPGVLRIAFVRAPPGSVSLNSLSVPTGGDIYSMRTDGTNVQRLTDDPATDLFPAWSPSGGRIAFASERDGNFEIYLMAADGTGEVNLTNDPAWDIGPTWSPTAGRIGFTSDRSGDAELWFVNRDGTAPTQVTSMAGFYALPSWAPDGSHLLGIGVFPSTGAADLYLALPDGRAVRYLTGVAEVMYSVAFRPR